MPYVTEDNLTDVALERWKDIPDPRLRQIMQSLIKHLHGFVRDIEPTQAEWSTAIGCNDPAAFVRDRQPISTSSGILTGAPAVAATAPTSSICWPKDVDCW